MIKFILIMILITILIVLVIIDIYKLNKFRKEYLLIKKESHELKNELDRIMKNQQEALNKIKYYSRH